MGVGYPLDLIVCSCLGVDMFDCVYPTRTARFGTALTRFGNLKLTKPELKKDLGPICKTCDCPVRTIFYFKSKAKLREGRKSEKPIYSKFSHFVYITSGALCACQDYFSYYNIKYSVFILNTQTCQKYTRSYLNTISTKEEVGCHLITAHNIYFLLTLMKSIHKAIVDEKLEEFVK